MNPSFTSTKRAVRISIPLLPVLPVAFFFLHNINQYIELILTFQVLLLFMIYVLFALGLFLCCKSLFKLSISQSLFTSTLTMIFFLFFGIIQDYLFQFKKLLFLSNSFFLVSCFIVFIVSISFFFKKKKIQPSGANLYLGWLFAILICYETVMLGMKLATGKTLSAITRRMTSPVLTDQKMGADRPDIYHIIFDEYTNPPALKKYWGFENDIYPFLASKGFYTLDSAFSNYTTTPFSISSMVNLQYLKGADPYLDRNSADFFVGHLVFRNNELFQFLKQAPYDFSIFSQLNDNSLLTTFGFLGVDKPVNWLRKQTMERIFLNPWVVEKIRKIFGKQDEEPPMIHRSKQNFAAYNKKALDHILSDCQRMLNKGAARPLYSFTHFMLPHEPYILDENGNFVSLANQTDDMNGYLRQVKYSNKLIKQITDCLLSDTTRKKIIIFQGDHGYRSYTNISIPSNTPYGALSAIYFYNKNYTGLRKDLSHVNTYRVIINNFFDGHLVLLKDSIVSAKSK